MEKWRVLFCFQGSFWLTEKALEVFEEKLFSRSMARDVSLWLHSRHLLAFLFGQAVIAKYQYLDNWVRKELWVSGKELLPAVHAAAERLLTVCLSSEKVFNSRKCSTALQKHLAEFCRSIVCFSSRYIPMASPGHSLELGSPAFLCELSPPATVGAPCSAWGF